MKAIVISLRLGVAALLAAACCLAAAAAMGDEISPVVTPSSTSLTFGVPDPQPGVSAIGTTSAQQKVTFSVSGESVTFGGTTAPGSADFKIVQDTCQNKTIAAGSFCTVVLTFTPSVSGLETDSFSVNFNEPDLLVNLSGAAGAIKLFNPTFVATSNGSGNPLINYGTSPLVLSCPAGDSTPTGVLSSSPDGSGYVFEDNFLTLAVNGTPAATGNSPAGNVCRGGTADGNDNDCFTTNYQSVAGTLLGDSPDTFANPGNNVLMVQDDNPNNAGGVPPIDVSSFLASGSLNTTFTLLDNGGIVAGSTLFLVSNCAVTGVQQGGTIVSNPINGDNAASQTPSFPFDTIGGQHIELGANFTALNGSSTAGNGIVDNTVATTFDTGITQSQFATMVHGTSAAPAVCLRMTGELASDGVTPLCKAITIECTNSVSSTPAGENCPQSTLRNLLFSLAFDTPDSLNILPGTGPGLLMGQDTWASAGPNQPAAPTACSFPTDATDPLANQLCPQDLLTSFIGAGDPVPGGTTRGTNSTFVPVLRMPLPFTIPIVALFQKTTTINLTFLASPAIFLPVNGFTPAHIQSVTFGTTPAGTPDPDPTLAVPGDISLFNTGAAVGNCSGTPGGFFKASTTLSNDTSSGNQLAEGRYNLHFFATDCASTEELLFTPSKDPAKNWASFKTIPIDIDLHAPTINNPTATRSKTTVTVTYSCTDPNVANAASGVLVCGTFLFPAVLNTPTLTSKFTVKVAGPGSISLTAMDLAGNSVTVNVPYN